MKMSCVCYTDEMNAYCEDNCDTQNKADSSDLDSYYEENHKRGESDLTLKEDLDFNLIKDQDTDEYSDSEYKENQDTDVNDDSLDDLDSKYDDNQDTDEDSDSENDSVNNYEENQDAAANDDSSDDLDSNYDVNPDTDEYSDSENDSVSNYEENEDVDEYDDSTDNLNSDYYDNQDTDDYSGSENDYVSNYEQNEDADEYEDSLDSNYDDNRNTDEYSDSADDSDLNYLESYDNDEDSDSPDDQNESSMLLLFYENLLDDLVQKFGVRYADVRDSIQLMMNCYRLVNCGKLPLEIDFNSVEYCIGYLHRYGACHMALVSEAVSTMLASSSALLSVVTKRVLNVMFLGGGPGNDFVGFLTALYGYHHLLILNVTIVDKMLGWKDVFMETVQRLKRGECDQAGQIFQDVIVIPSFITSDLKELNESYSEDKLRRTDLVFFVKSLSHIPDDEKFMILLNVAFHLKPGALLVYIDFPFPYGTFAALSNFLRLVYQSNKTHYHFHMQSFKFGYPSISNCKAEVRVFERL